MSPLVQNLPASPVALLRYQIVSHVLASMVLGVKRARAVEQATSMTWLAPDGRQRKVSKRTVYRLLEGFRERGIAAFEPARRGGSRPSLVLSDAFLAFLEQQKRLDPKASIPEIVLRARVLGIVERDERIDRVTVWRVAKRMGLAVQQRKSSRERDVRRYRLPHRMQMLLCDGKHFRAGEARLRRVAYFYLDNATRYGLNVVVGTSENAALFLRGLYEVVASHGCAVVFYLDKGAGFIADDAARVIEQLGGLLIHGEAGYPPARGAVEKFIQTALHGFLRNLDGRPDVDPDCGALELMLEHYLRETYNNKPHEGLGNDTPRERWDADPRSLRLPDDYAQLRSKFLVEHTRDVSNDNVVSFESVAYEVPRGHARTKVTVYRQVLDKTLHVPHEGRLVQLHPVDLVANAMGGRAHPAEAPGDEPSVLPPSAAELAFQRDLAPVVGPDGGFTDPKER